MNADTLLIGNIYSSQLISGSLEKDSVTDIIFETEEIAKKLGIKHFYDVIVEREKHIDDCIRILSSVNNNPFIFDSGSPRILERVIQSVSQTGFSERLVINSINNYTLTESLLKNVNRYGVRNAIIQIFNPQDPTAEGRIKVLEALLKKLKNSSITNIIVDCAITDINSIAEVIKSFKYVKSGWDLPVGAAPCNLTYILKRRTPEFIGKNSKSFDTALNILLRSYGADFLIYGHIKSHNRIFKAIYAHDYVIKQLSAYKFNFKK